MDGDKRDTAFIVLAAVNGFISREERFNALNNLCNSAFVKFGLRKIIGMATESANSLARSEDFYIAEGLSFEGAELIQIERLAEKLWGRDLKHSRETEFR